MRICWSTSFGGCPRWSRAPHPDGSFYGSWIVAFIHLYANGSSHQEKSGKEEHVLHLPLCCNPGYVSALHYQSCRHCAREYHLGLQEGTAFNLPESLKLAMEAKGLDKTNAEIYSKIAHYGNYLKEKGALTEKEANMESEGK